MLGFTLLVCGCGGSDPGLDSPESNQLSAETSPAKTAEAPKVVVDFDQLEDRASPFELPHYYFEEKPFTGVAVRKYANGKKMGEVTFKDGKQHGLSTSWHENGQKAEEATFKDGTGRGTRWYENGQKRGEATFKDGEMISEKEWDKDGNLIKEE